MIISWTLFNVYFAKTLLQGGLDYVDSVPTSTTSTKPKILELSFIIIKKKVTSYLQIVSFLS